MQRAAFLVGDTPYAVCDWDLMEKNADFIRGIDSAHYEYLAEVHGAHLDGTNRHQAAVAMRAAYHHAQETLFTLLCAALQTPYFVPGRAQKCRTDQLRSLVREITEEGCKAGNFLGLDIVTWQGDWVGASEGRTFTEAEVALAQAFADQAATAIQTRDCIGKERTGSERSGKRPRTACPYRG